MAGRHAQIKPCEDDSTLVAEVKKVMASDLSTRYKGTRDALNIASALDPRFKELPYLEKEDREQVYAKLVLEAQQIPAMGNEEEGEGGSSPKLSGSQEETTASNESPPCKKKALDALFGDSFTQRERKSTSETARAEVIRRTCTHQLLTISALAGRRVIASSSLSLQCYPVILLTCFSFPLKNSRSHQLPRHPAHLLLLPAEELPEPSATPSSCSPASPSR
ncbi:unnamed protein product [Pleuronectes platessa]|uniref:Uncharacterized protein n=1 Tax=Pleuronectes platessa TaxID=8262 RepID=A0A9N7ZA62_PLEPL|nr:unnamed protein product [Pleuronectes platessa]